MGKDRKPVGKLSHSARIIPSVRPRGGNRALRALSLWGGRAGGRVLCRPSETWRPLVQTADQGAPLFQQCDGEAHVMERPSHPG